MTKSIVFGSRSTADQVLAGIDLTGKHYLITGAAGGIGLQTASALAANGGHVVVMARTLDDARQACREIGYSCSPLQCDLGDLDSVADAVAAVRRLDVRLDAIVANAGIASPESLSLHSGIEQQFFVNHIGHFALINGLAELLRDASGRVVIVSSNAAAAGAANSDIMFDNLAGQRFYHPERFYRQSKLANALYAKELSRRLHSRGVVVNCADPGAVRGTAIARHSSLLRRLARSAARPFRRSPAQGAATSALLAASPSVSGVSGQYWRHCQVAPGNSELEDADLAARLWKVSEEIIAQHRSSQARLLAHAA
jgi:NAD(P)-dependent dehydrogenase (short-subunit alcohol dehydrogenase family)